MTDDLKRTPTNILKEARYHPEREAIMNEQTSPVPPTILTPVYLELKYLRHEIDVLKVRLSEIERRTGIHEPTGE